MNKKLLIVFLILASSLVVSPLIPPGSAPKHQKIKPASALTCAVGVDQVNSTVGTSGSSPSANAFPITIGTTCANEVIFLYAVSNCPVCFTILNDSASLTWHVQRDVGALYVYQCTSSPCFAGFQGCTNPAGLFAHPTCAMEDAAWAIAPTSITDKIWLEAFLTQSVIALSVAGANTTYPFDELPGVNGAGNYGYGPCMSMHPSTSFGAFGTSPLTVNFFQTDDCNEHTGTFYPGHPPDLNLAFAYYNRTGATFTHGAGYTQLAMLNSNGVDAGCTLNPPCLPMSFFGEYNMTTTVQATRTTTIGYTGASGQSGMWFTDSIALAPPHNVTIDSSPSGLHNAIIVDGVTYTGPQTFSWAIGSVHNLTAIAHVANYGFGWWVNDSVADLRAPAFQFQGPWFNATITNLVTQQNPSRGNTLFFTAMYYNSTMSSVPNSSHAAASDIYVPIGHTVHLNMTTNDNLGCTNVNDAGNLCIGNGLNPKNGTYGGKIFNLTNSSNVDNWDGWQHHDEATVTSHHANAQTFIGEVVNETTGAIISNSTRVTIHWAVLGGMLCFSYKLIGGGIYDPPILSYSNGTAKMLTLTFTTQCITASNGTMWSITNPLKGPSASGVERAQSQNTTSGTVIVNFNETVVYWHQFGAQWRYVVVSGTPTVGHNPTLSFKQFGLTTTIAQSKTYQQIWMDAATPWNAQNPWFDNLQNFIARPASGVILSSAPMTIFYSLAPSCTSTDPFTDLLAGCLVGTFYYTFAEVFGNFGLAGIDIAVAVAIYLKTENPMSAVLFIIVSAGVVATMLPGFFLQLGSILLVVSLAGGIFQIIRER